MNKWYWLRPAINMRNDNRADDSAWARSFHPFAKLTFPDLAQAISMRESFIRCPNSQRKPP
jgi:hypothetical protein